jgi:TonB family protein
MKKRLSVRALAVLVFTLAGIVRAQTKLRKGRVLHIVARPPAATAGNRDELYCAEVMRTYLQLIALLFASLGLVAQSAEPSSPSSAAFSEHCPAISKTPDTVSKGGPVTSGRLIKKVCPKYPASARKAHTEGTVVLCATISEDGVVQNLRALFGPPELIPAAMDAAKQWRYMPYRLNDKPVEVDSEIHIDFKLGGR